jgi:photosystem II stability/assembly factor-like uncharacterized protein
VTDRSDDELDRWLSADVELLPPGAGTFERIRRRARQRKARQALASAAAAAVVIAGGASAPAIISSLSSAPSGPGPGQQSLAGGGTATPASTPGGSAAPSATPPAASPSVSPSSLPSASSSVTLRPSSLSQAKAGAAVAARFQPTSITFVSSRLGAAIGQGKPAGQCSSTPTCTSLAGTDDYGKTWFGVSAPATGFPDGDAGVSQVRFLNQDQGFAFGPALWATQDGGASWSEIGLPSGIRVTDLETVDGQVLAVWAQCQGDGIDFAADCSRFTLETADAAAAVEPSAWRAVPGATALRSGASASSAMLTLAAGETAGASSGTVFLLAPDGRLLAGGLTGQRLTTDGQVPADCLPGPPQPGAGTPSEALLTYQSGRIYLLCSGGTRPVLYVSADRGRSWPRQPAVPRHGTPTSLAADANGLVVIATTEGLVESADNGQTWRLAVGPSGGTGAGSGRGPGGGFSYVGMTDQDRGVALPADTGLHQVWITRDGGQDWQPSVVRSRG